MKIGVFDSGLGGLSILRKIRALLPEYDYLYLGDNARAPYGTRSFEVIYDYTWQAVQYLFKQDCQVVILACNTASAKALRTIQQVNLPDYWAHDQQSHERRVLGVIRPTVESVSALQGAAHIGILATPGTVGSDSYAIELHKLNPAIQVTQQACPMWVPLIENDEIDSPAMDYFVDRYMRQLMNRDAALDMVLLGCTHYPLIEDKILSWLQANSVAGCLPEVVAQGQLVAESLRDYLTRHPEQEQRLSRGGQCAFQTTESAERFQEMAQLFLEQKITAEHVDL